MTFPRVSILTRSTPAFLLLAVAIMGCEGPTGPTGPQGPTGAAGPEGPQGPAGSANVLSGTLATTDADWSTNTVQFFYQSSPNSGLGGKPARYLDLDIPELTASVVAGGVVLVWIEYSPMHQPDSYSSLPYRFLPLSSTQAWTYALQIREGVARVMFFKEDLNDPTNFSLDPLTPAQADRQFKWVIIPPAAASEARSLPVEMGPQAVVAELERRGVSPLTR